MVPSKVTFPFLFPALVLFITGCGAVLINEGSKDEPLSDGLKNPEVKTVQVAVPPDQSVISNFEDGLPHMNPKLYGAPAGKWTATSPAGIIDTPLVVAGGANGTAMAIRVTGTLVNKGDNSYPAFLLAGKFKPRGFFDASPFHGIRFYYKCSTDDQAPRHRFSVPIAPTVPTSSGGSCTDGCYNHFGADLPPASEWSKKVYAFTDLQRGSGWGSPVTPPDFTDHLKEIIDIEWMEGSENAAGTYKIDYWVDEVEFF